MFWVMLLIYIATTIISALLASKNKTRPSALGDFQFPTAEEGRAIPVVFGTVKISGGNTVWWGDLRTSALKAGSFLGIGGTVVGYKYYIGVQYALCQGPVDLISLQSDNKPVPYVAVGTDPMTLTINQPNLFGGDKSGGGLAGTLRFYRGTTTQPSDAYLSAKQTAVPSIPVYSGSGNGFLAFLAPGPASVNETITIKATTLSGGHMQFSVTGSVSGGLGTAHADTNFATSHINFLITTGSIQFVTNDQFQVTTTPARVSPNYKRLCYAVLQQFYVGTSSYPKPINFVVRYCPDPFAQGDSIARLNVDGSGADANPALAIYTILTNVDWGLGISPSMIDATNFQAQAHTLSLEGLGISTQVDTPSSADSIVSEILRHIDGFLYVEPTTGLWTLVLARADYDPSTLPILTPDQVLEVPKFSRAQWWETINQIFVQYTDRNADFQMRTVQNHDLSNVILTNETRAETMDFKMLSNGADAALVCTRALRAVAYPLSKLTLKVNRAAWKWRVGGVFKFTWPQFGISNEVYRITRIAWGELLNSAISVECVEDVFGIQAAAFAAPPGSGWSNPSGPVAAPVWQRLEEVPYSLAVIGALSGIYVFAFCARQDAAIAFEVWQSITSVYQETNDLSQFCPVGVLAAAYTLPALSRDPVGFTVGAAGADLAALASTDEAGLLAGRNLALIDEEIVSWKTATVNTDGSVTCSDVIRGVLDTVPAAHAQGTTVWFFYSLAQGTTQLSPYSIDQTVTAKLLPKTTTSTYPIASAAPITLTTRSRYPRPFPPGNVQVNGNPWGTIPSSLFGDLVISWSSRNRVTQTSAQSMVLQDATDIPPEDGTTYAVEIYIAGTFIRRVDLISSSPFTYSAAQRATDDADLTKLVSIRLYSTNADGLDSMFYQTFSITMTGDMLTTGRYEFTVASVGGVS